MYVVTNRDIHRDRDDLDQFGSRPNRLGPNELRMAKVTRKGRNWSVTWQDDILDKEEAQALQSEFDLNIDVTEDHYASLRVACELARKSREEKTNILLFVHGFNNDMKAVVKRAEELKQLYKVEVVPFSWPANGGGIKGAADYKSDKRDARSSAGALDRTIAKVGHYLNLISEANRTKLRIKASEKYPKDREKQDQLYSQLLEKDCPFTVNLMLHSMGNYLYKQMLKSTLSEGNLLIFDNVLLVAGDTNNKDHVEWVDKIRCRKRCYITINENDRALAASRAKFGEQQLARLGHYVRDLSSKQAYYINFTAASWVKNSHSYFEREVAGRNKDVFKFFNAALNGHYGESTLQYKPSGNYFEV
jgi:esterase/lipase superfamily enzyme